MKYVRCLPLVVLFVVSCREAPPTAASKVDELLNLVHERLAQMPAVAKAKVDLNLPVEDAKREEALLQAAEVDAAKNGLDVAFVRAFFTDQFEASKKLQQLEMKKAPHPQSTEEGMKQAGQRLEEARAKINSINVKMLTALVTLKNLSAAERKQLVEASGKLAAYDDDVRQTATATLRSEQSP